MDVGDRGVGVDTAGPEACNSGRAQVRSVESARSTWAPAFDPELEAALDEALAHVPIETPVAARRAGAGRPGASRSPDDDPGTSAGDPTRCLGPLADLPPRPPAPGGEAGGPAHPARGHLSSFGRKDHVEIRGPASLRLEHLGLPPAVVDRFVAGGVRSGAVYPWQRAAIDEGSDGSNLVYCAPTSGGKSLVANVLLARALARRAARGAPGRALVVLPFQSLVNEKVRDLKQLLAPMYRKRDGGKKRGPEAVRGYAGECEGTPLARPLGPGQEAVAVTTIEKACVAVSRLAAENRLHELCAVVVDELHMVGDEDRGATLEAALAKLRFHERTRRRDAANRGEKIPPCQIIAMSATVAHDSLERLAGWLDARLFVTNYRPVPLAEHVVADGAVFAKNETPRGPAGFERVRGVPETFSEDDLNAAEVPLGDRVASQLIAEAANEGYSCLAFCPSRNKTEALALALARAFEVSLLKNKAVAVRRAATRRVAAARARLTRRLFAAAEGAPAPGLARVADMGIAFHHAHMRAKEKEAIEEAFRDGALLVLCCTTTLAAGVNLPARRVVTMQGAHPMKAASYRQMAGRAGRAGHADRGESFVIPHGNDKKNVAAAFELVEARLPALESKVLAPARESTTRPELKSVATARDDIPEDGGNVGLAALALQCICAGTFKTRADGHELMRSTLAFGEAKTRARLAPALDLALKHLRDDEALIETFDADDGARNWRATGRGLAAHRSALPVRHATALYDDLRVVARRGVFLEAPEGEKQKDGFRDKSTDANATFFFSRNAVSFGRLHLLFLCAPRGDASASRGRNPFDARRFDWSAWYDSLSHSPALRQLGAKLGVELAHAARARATGGGGGNRDPAVAARLEKHRRMAAAAAVAELLDGGDVAETCARWRTVAGGLFLPGTLQQLSSETASVAAMAANLATSAGWRGVASLLDALSRELDAGARRELAPLVAVSLGRDDGGRSLSWTMTVARARALFKAGIKTPRAVLEAAEEDVRDAVARADRGKDDATARKKGNATGRGSAASSVSAARAARELVEACRLFEMRRLAAEVDATGELDGVLREIPNASFGDEVNDADRL
jgi:DNA polymerase theta